MSIRWLSPCLLTTLFAVGCASTRPTIEPEQLAAAEAGFLGPFIGHRAVYGSELEIVVSPNFYERLILPAASKSLHELSRSSEGGDDLYRWTNKAGGVESMLKFRIRETDFVAERVATLRVLGNGKPMTCQVTARGNVMESASGTLDQWQEYRISDGDLVRR